MQLRGVEGRSGVCIGCVHVWITWNVISGCVYGPGWACVGCVHIRITWYAITGSALARLCMCRMCTCMQNVLCVDDLWAVCLCMTFSGGGLWL